MASLGRCLFSSCAQFLIRLFVFLLLIPMGSVNILDINSLSDNLTPIRLAIIKRQEINVGKDVEKRESLHTISGVVNRFSHYGKKYEVSFKK